MEAVVLAGGLGTRLRSVVSDLPKCMAPIGAGNESRHTRACPGDLTPEPFLSYVLDWLSHYDISHVILSVGYLKDAVMDWVSGRQFPFEVDFAVEDEPLGTGGAIRYALSKCRERKVIVVNGDTFFPVDLDAIPFDSPVTVALKPMKDFDRYGAVTVTPDLFGSLNQSVQILAFKEKAPVREGLINGGVYALNGLDLSSFPEKFSFEKDVLEPLSAKGVVGGWVSDRYFLDIGVPEDYARAQTELPQYRAVKDFSSRIMAVDADTLLLDRDGTLNVRIVGDYVRRPEQLVMLPGILEEMPLWAGKFRHIIIVTNQRGVGRGLMTDEDLASVHRHLLSLVQATGGRIDAILTCTAVSDDDPRRKPNPGMYREARMLFPDIRKAVMAGDGECDRVFAANAGIDFIPVSCNSVVIN